MCAVIGLMLAWLGKIPAKGVLFFCLIGVSLYALSRISAELIKPIYLGMMLLTFPIGWVVSHLVMVLFYCGIITPVALIFRLLKRDPLCRRYEPDANTYWLRYKQKRFTKDYFRQF